jgi:hypothetical protein
MAAQDRQIPNWRRLMRQLSIADTDSCMEDPKDIDLAAIEENARRIVERTALRKVRKKLDEIRDAEDGQRRSLRKIVIVCTILAVLGAWLFWSLIFPDRGMPKPTQLEVPGTLQQKQ